MQGNRAILAMNCHRCTRGSVGFGASPISLSETVIFPAIPTIVNGGNHTPGFEKSAATDAAHSACLDVSKALAATGVRVLIDDKFMESVRQAFEEDKILRQV
ncbi:hypothetical protein BD779DRAFT_1522996 [Infundibulicybe gibba]|nr:hypothetical protein BD779DRAFT_1522996 [Infundibulicybe gibba]